MFIIADKRPMQPVGRIKVVAKPQIRFAGKVPVKKTSAVPPKRDGPCREIRQHRLKAIDGILKPLLDKRDTIRPVMG